ncbi:LysR family transcriptional regulator [Cryptosporangium sp. NPDC048952]|uniref:LysR family transcriptional regulator n=1 Tax=Cryptosporangium sp. NPDC048952 TaxID=3363961 RepID=UPI003715D4D1
MLGTRRLQLLVALAETGSIAAAAATVGCSAAAASRQLAVLEEESSALLLERSARSVRLTAAGEMLADHARRILADIDTAEQDVAAAGSVGGGRLRVGSFSTAARRFVVPVLGTLRRRYPRLRLSFAEVEPENALPAVRAGELDAAVIHHYSLLAAPDTHGLRRTTLYTEPLVLAVPHQLSAAGVATTDVRAFADADWISTYPDRGFQAVTELTARLAGFELRISGRAAGYPVVLDLVAAGLGVALVPQSAAVPQAGVRLLDITEPAGLTRTVELTTRAADSSPAVAEFRREIIKHSSAADQDAQGRSR